VKTIGHERVDAESPSPLDGVDGERPAHLGAERYFDWHAAQCPMTSRACAVTRKPC
jgi:hypothetical protein